MMEEIKAEIQWGWYCPTCTTWNEVKEENFKGEKQEKDYTIQQCRHCDTESKVIKE